MKKVMSNGTSDNGGNLPDDYSVSNHREVEIMAKLSKHPNAVKEGGNIKSIALIQAMQKWDKIDLFEPKQVRKRIDKFFNLMAEHDSKPLVSGLACALGVSRHVLWEITRGLVTTNKATHIPKESREIIIDAYNAMEMAWEYNFANGNINPATGIFLAKNHYGYKNQTEVVVQPKNVLGEEHNPEEIAQRYLASIATEKKK